MYDLIFFWWGVFRCVHTLQFDDALLQTRLSVGRAMLSRSSLFTPDTVKDLNLRLDEFGLSMGVHMEKLWKAFRPVAPVSGEQLHILLQLEDLARRFDTIKWILFQSIEAINSLAVSLTQAYRKVLMDRAPGEYLIKVRIPIIVENGN